MLERSWIGIAALDWLDEEGWGRFNQEGWGRFDEGRGRFDEEGWGKFGEEGRGKFDEEGRGRFDEEELGKFDEEVSGVSSLIMIGSLGFISNTPEVFIISETSIIYVSLNIKINEICIIICIKV